MGKNKGQWQDHRNTAGNPDQPYQPENAISANPSKANMDTPQTTDPVLTPPESGDLAAQQGSLSANPPSTPPPTPDLAAFVSNLTQEQRDRLRSLASAQGIATGPRKGPGGGLIIEVEVPEQVFEPFREWPESAGESLVDFIRKVAADSLIAYCYQDWGAVAMQQQQTATETAAATTITVAP